jgi:NitT/TauT family transport system ATP-binding protein
MSVTITDVCKRYQGRGGEVVALDRTSLIIEDREFVSIVGPSGCGKSTLLMIMAGLVSPTEGSVVINGKQVLGPFPQLGMVFQQDALLPWRSVLQNVLLQACIRKLGQKQLEGRARELLAMVGLAGFENMYPHELSGGMRQRVSICRALLHQPTLLLMDEPFGALDALTRDQLNIDLQRICTDLGVTTVFVTHSIDEAVFLSDRMIIMSPRPSTVKETLTIDLPRPRKLTMRAEPAFATCARDAILVFERVGVLHENA